MVFLQCITEDRQIVVALPTQVVAIARVVTNMVERNERLLYSYLITGSCNLKP